MRASAWSATEKGILNRYYPLEGAKGVAKRLKRRTVDAVRVRAHKVGLTFGERPGMILAKVVHPDSKAENTANRRIIREAERDGVLEVIGRGTRKMQLVPVEWADAYSERLARECEKRRETSGWLSTPEAARELGVSQTSVARSLQMPSRYGLLGRALRGVRRVKFGDGYGAEYRWHPGDVRLAALRYRALKAGAA